MASWWSGVFRAAALDRSHVPKAANATQDFYFLNAIGDLVAPLGSRAPAKPIEQIGPNSFAAGNRLVVIRYVTERELRLIGSRSWDRIDYIIDDLIMSAAISMDLPEDYRARLRSFTDGPLSSLIRLRPSIVAPSPDILEAYAGLDGTLVDPCLPVPIDAEQRLRHHGAGGPLRMCFLGTRSHSGSLGFLADVAERLPRAVPGARLTLFFGEHLPDRLRRHVAVDNRRPLSWPQFKSFTRIERFHVALAPLSPTPFNRGRSITKTLDTAAVGAVGVYSDLQPFRGCVSHAEDGLLLGSKPEDWIATLVDLNTDRGHCRKLAAGGIALANTRGDRNRQRRFWLERLRLTPPSSQ